MQKAIGILFLIGYSILAMGNDPLDETFGEVWLDGEALQWEKNEKGEQVLYFQQWSEKVAHFLTKTNRQVALRLDENLNPIPHDALQLPSLYTLSRVSEKALVASYFRFLENHGRTLGFQHLVLPDTTHLHPYEKEVLQIAYQVAPRYFLFETILMTSLPENRRLFADRIRQDPVIWVLDPSENHKRLSKWNKKVSNPHEQFYQALRQERLQSYEEMPFLPIGLKRKIYSASIAAVDPNYQLPIRANEITYLGHDEKLRKRLGQYATVYTRRLTNVPCVVDLRSGQEFAIAAGDITLTPDAGESYIPPTLVLPGFTLDHSDIIIAQMLFGAHAISGRDAIAETREVADGGHMGYSDPEWVDMNANFLSWLDTLGLQAIRQWATPGLQLVVVKDGQFIKKKAYGYYTYDSLKEVEEETLYDVASLTKVMATLPAIALLVDQGALHLDDSISSYLKEFQNSNKSGITIRQLLAHQAGLKAYVPFWRMTMDGDRLNPFYYQSAEDEANDNRTYGYEPHPAMRDSLKGFIVKSAVAKQNQYIYSDLGFMILHLLVEEVTKLPFDQFMTENFYAPMGLKNTGFSPLKRGVSYESIAPTEYDQYYRRSLVWGEVHDRNAAVFGGTAGHAGLFSNATDLAKMMAMFLNKGSYAGRQYLSPETLQMFNQRYFEDNRRGLGWDKPGETSKIASSLASDSSFGHTGFTGTMVWADPDEQLIFVFLSNRLYPDASNWKLNHLKTRTHMHEIIYRSIRE